MIFIYHVYASSGVKDASTINSDVTLGDLGLDSLMGVEVKQTLERDFDLSLSMKDIRALTMHRLAEISSGTVTKEMVRRSSDDERAKESAESLERIKHRYDLQNMVPQQCLVKLNQVIFE